MHRKYPILGVLTLCLIFFAAALAAASRAAEYNGVALPGLASRDASQSFSDATGKLRLAQNADAPAKAEAPAKPKPSSKEDAASEEARKRLKKELERVRRNAQDGGGDAQSGASKPKKGKEAETAAAKPQPAKKPAPPAAAGISSPAGKLIIMQFSGTAPSDPGPKAIRALLHDGLIAGVMFRGENIQTKGQLKELMKFFWQGGSEPRPVFAISETGGAGNGLPRIKDFESWPSQQEVASKGDPEYAYLTYRSLGSYLAILGFNMNFGPVIEAAASGNGSASFGAHALQAGVFAKTFLLGHRDDNVITVPVVDGSDLAVRAVKSLLVSNPALPIAAAVTSDPPPFAPYDGLVNGVRFCLTAVSPSDAAAGASGNFAHGCDVLVVDGGKESPAVIRELIAQDVSNAIKAGTLTSAALEASAHRLSALRSPPPPAEGFTTKTSQ